MATTLPSLSKWQVATTLFHTSGGLHSVCPSFRLVFLYAFAKSDRDNIDADELEALRTIGANWLAASAELVGQAIEDGDLKEIEHDDDEA